MIIKLVCIFFMVIHGMGRAGEDEKRGVVWCEYELLDDIPGSQSMASNAVRLD